MTQKFNFIERFQRAIYSVFSVHLEYDIHTCIFDELCDDKFIFPCSD